MIWRLGIRYTAALSEDSTHKSIFGSPTLICKLLAINSLSQFFLEFIYFIIIHISLVCKRQRQMDF